MPEPSPSPGRTTADVMFLAALTSAVFGGLASLALLLQVGRHSPQHVLLVLFVLWVGAPFAALTWAIRAARDWRSTTRRSVHALTIVITVAALACYSGLVPRPPKAAAMFMWTLVPGVSWVIFAVGLGLATLVSRRLARAGIST